IPSSNNQRHRMNSFFPSTQTCLARTPGTICSRGRRCHALVCSRCPACRDGFDEGLQGRRKSPM
ncbi:hypothetical protein K474DRAFT_1667823, partial [Panus rudis PR-1116 ss-1]